MTTEPMVKNGWVSKDFFKDEKGLIGLPRHFKLSDEPVEGFVAVNVVLRRFYVVTEESKPQSPA